MAITLNNKFQLWVAQSWIGQFWSGRVRSGPVGIFFRWWFTEIKQVLPARWRERLQYAQRRLTLTLETDRLLLGVAEGDGIVAIGEIALVQDAVLQRQQLRMLLDEHQLHEAPRFLLLDAEHVLCKELMLPAAAESNLQQVLGFEMDRQTPFRAADVYFTWLPRGTDKETGQIRLDLFVVPRKPVEAALQTLTQCGLSPGGIDVLDQGKVLGVNLLPPEKRVGMVSPRTWLNLGLAAAALMLLVVVMAQSLAMRAHRVEVIEAAIAEVQDEARRVQRLREQVQETSEAASFLTRHRAASPMAIDVLADVTRLLPDTTYLDRLVINADSVLMQGKSRNAQQLIEMVNNSDLLDHAAFRGSTRLDAQSGLEIFEVNAAITATLAATDTAATQAAPAENP